MWKAGPQLTMLRGGGGAFNRWGLKGGSPVTGTGPQRGSAALALPVQLSASQTSRGDHPDPPHHQVLPHHGSNDNGAK
jgi:hypothetical protein